MDKPDHFALKNQKDLLLNNDFNRMVEYLQVMVCVHDINRCVYVNPAAEKCLGYSLKELKAIKIWDIIHQEDRIWVKPRAEARLRGENVPPTHEFRILKKNGQVMWIKVFYHITSWSGRNVNLLGFIDITENKRLNEELQASRSELELRVEQRTEELNKTNKELMFLNQNLNNILKNISDGVATVNDSGDVELLNSFFKRMPTHRASEIKNILKDMILNDSGSALYKMLREKKSFKDEEMIFPASEGSFSLLVSGTPILDEGGDVHSGVIVLKPMKDVHRLIQRFSGYHASFCFEDIITNDPIMFTLIENAKNTALSISNVVIEGESGTGKELFAQAIHKHSARSNGPFIAINCGATPRELIASELFGYAEGAFTGAKKNGNPGKFELASGGTLFLDEIGDMPLDQQCSLLRVIQEKKLTRIGGCHTIAADVRIICATNKDLYNEMKMGSFRNDLYYRLNVINIKIPPLRERRKDIILLFNYFMKTAENHAGKNAPQINDEVKRYLLHYDWPGNVRELQNVVERLVNITSGTCVEVDHLPQEIKKVTSAIGASNPTCLMPEKTNVPIHIKTERNLSRQRTGEAQKKHIIRLLELHHWNINRVAKELGISRTTLYKKIKFYNNSSNC